MRLGVVGLGVGTLSAYGRAGDTVRFYELDPDVLALAKNYFSYLPSAPSNLEFVIGDARVTETELPRTPGVRSTFTNEQAQRYDGRMAAAIEIRQVRGNFRVGDAAASATRTRSVAENISLNDRERVWYEMVEQMMADINGELERQVRANLPRFLAI